MKAFAIGCMMPTPKYIAMTKICIHSIREMGHDEDIVVVTVDKSLPAILRHERCYVRCFDTIRYSAVDKHLKVNPQGNFRLCDAQKIHFWKLTEYDKILAVDADVTLTKPFAHWGLPELSVRQAGLYGTEPINTGVMLLRPSLDTVEALWRVATVLEYPESDKTFEFNGRMWKWDFKGNFTAQGYVFAHFFQKEEIHPFHFNGVTHWSGRKKHQPSYRSLLAKHIKL